MANAGLHEARKELSRKTRDRHRALVSLQEELEAIDWYYQRADACRDAQLKAILLHNMREEMEHSAMLIEGLRREDSAFDQQLRACVFSNSPILEGAAAAAGQAPADDFTTPTIGSLKE